MKTFCSELEGIVDKYHMNAASQLRCSDLTDYLCQCLETLDMVVQGNLEGLAKVTAQRDRLQRAIDMLTPEVRDYLRDRGVLP